MRTRILQRAIIHCCHEVHRCGADVHALAAREFQIATGTVRKLNDREPREIQLRRVRNEITNRLALQETYKSKAEQLAREMYR